MESTLLKNKKLLIIGASGHGKVVADIAKKNGYNEIAFLDDNDMVKECDGYQVVGKTKDFIHYDSDMFVAIGNSQIRERIMDSLKAEDKSIPTLIHPSAVIAEIIEIGEGTVVGAGAVINPGAKIGRGCIINTSSSVDHDCVVSDFAHVSVGAHVAGTVSIGKHTWIGAGATVSNNVNICDNCMIGAGAVVVKNIDKSGTYIGVPAMKK